MPYTIFPNINQNTYWGNISGNIANQQDLNDVLAAKSEANHSHNDLQVSQFQTISFSKYGSIAEGEHISPFFIFLENNYSAEIIRVHHCIASGTIEASIKLNGELIESLSEMVISSAKTRIDLAIPLGLSNGDTLTLTVDSATGAANLYFDLIIKLTKNYEN